MKDLCFLLHVFFFFFSEKFLRAVLYGSSASGEDSPCLRQSTYPALVGLLEVFPLPFTIYRHSSGVRPGQNAEFAMGRIDCNDYSHPATESTLAGMRHSLKCQALHERLINPVQQPHTFLFDHINSGERHTIVFDLGAEVCLTDLIVFPCTQLSSLAVHVWSTGGNERQAKRVAVCTNIAQQSLVLSDLCPQLRCRYVKVSLCSYDLEAYFAISLHLVLHQFSS